MTGKTQFGRVVGDTLAAQGENIAIILRPGQFPANDLKTLPNRVFGNQLVNTPKRNIWVIEEDSTGYRIIDHHTNTNLSP